MIDERETVIIWSAKEETFSAWTDDPATFKQWKSLGYPVKIFGKTKKGEPRSWEALDIPLDRMVFRRIAIKKP